jgi:integrase
MVDSDTRRTPCRSSHSRPCTFETGNPPWPSRPPRIAANRKRRAVDKTDLDALRARRATANRTLTVLKAALNHAYHEGRVASDDAWREVKRFREADAPVVHFLSDDECRRIANASDGAFRNIVKGALVTGCRYGELTRMRAADFNAEAGIVTVRTSKAGKPRHVALADEGRALFSELTAGRASVRWTPRVAAPGSSPPRRSIS